jgi:hypothetical protein
MKCKLYLISYAAVHSSDSLHPSIAGGHWVEVGTFTSDECQKFAANMQSKDIGDIGGPAKGLVV